MPNVLCYFCLEQVATFDTPPAVGTLYHHAYSEPTNLMPFECTCLLHGVLLRPAYPVDVHIWYAIAYNPRWNALLESTE